MHDEATRSFSSRLRRIGLRLAVGATILLAACGAKELDGGSRIAPPLSDAAAQTEQPDASIAEAAPVTDAPTTCVPNCPVSTLAVVGTSVKLACSPDVIYVSNIDKQIFAVPLAAPTPTEVTPPPAGVVGYLAWRNGRLFYTLPAEGEVHVRDLTSGQDVRLATGQPSPQGIAVTASGTDVFFATETGISRVAPDGADQTPTPRIVFADLGLPPRGVAKGLALAGARFVVAHAPLQPDQLSGALGTYSSTAEQISFYTFFSKTIGVASSETHTYWSQSEGALFSGPRPILSTGLTPTAVVRDQVSMGDICLQGKRMYFTAANADDFHEIRAVEVE
jgi:hypothetical protein